MSWPPPYIETPPRVFDSNNTCFQPSTNFFPSNLVGQFGAVSQVHAKSTTTDPSLHASLSRHILPARSRLGKGQACLGCWIRRIKVRKAVNTVHGQCIKANSPTVQPQTALPAVCQKVFRPWLPQQNLHKTSNSRYN